MALRARCQAERVAGWASIFGGDHAPYASNAPAHAPYCYEEEDWTDDMALAAVELYVLTHEPHYLHRGIRLHRADA